MKNTEDLWTNISSAVGIDRQTAKLVIMQVIYGMSILQILKENKLPLMTFTHLIAAFDEANNTHEE
tara:strand:- start:590 stop:787 length:198 start_codon:yes stop_codon:yes gene_type:complete